MKLKTAYKLIVIVLLTVILFLMSSGTSRLILIIIVIIESSIVFKTLFLDTKRKEWVNNLAIAIFSLIIFLFLLESVFMFVKRSDPSGIPLASQNWYNTYFYPYINSYGFRDEEPNKTSESNIFFVGDSFTEGDGIKDTKDRFSNVVKAKLLNSSKALNVYNLGLQGEDTRDEYESMMKFIKKSNIKPKCIVLQYFGNDIEKVAEKNGLKFPEFKPYKQLNPIVKNLVSKSYLLNYFYWPWFRTKVEVFVPYFKFLEKGYSTDSIFYQHTQDLRLFFNYSKDNNIPFIVVIFPFMHDVDVSKKFFVDKLKYFFDENKVDYIDVCPLIKDLSVEKRIVNSSDGHASVYVNKLVGNALYEKTLFNFY